MHEVKTFLDIFHGMYYRVLTLLHYTRPRFSRFFASELRLFKNTPSGHIAAAHMSDNGLL